MKTTCNCKSSAEAYQAAWERGKALDLETVVKALLDEFAEDAE